MASRSLWGLGVKKEASPLPKLRVLTLGVARKFLPRYSWASRERRTVSITI